jgi:hypothetical protein
MIISIDATIAQLAGENQDIDKALESNSTQIANLQIALDNPLLTSMSYKAI